MGQLSINNPFGVLYADNKIYKSVQAVAILYRLKQYCPSNLIAL